MPETAKPWVQSPDDPYEIRDSAGSWIATFCFKTIADRVIGHTKRIHERDEKRAVELAVKAVNNYDKLVEALAGTLGLIDSLAAADDANGWLKSQESYSVANAVLQEVRK